MSNSLDPRYPKAKYHAKQPHMLVADEKEEAALGDGWFDHPSLKNKPVFLKSGEVIDASDITIETAPAPKPEPKKAK